MLAVVYKSSQGTLKAYILFEVVVVVGVSLVLSDKCGFSSRKASLSLRTVLEIFDNPKTAHFEYLKVTQSLNWRRFISPVLNRKIAASTISIYSNPSGPVAIFCLNSNSFVVIALNMKGDTRLVGDSLSDRFVNTFNSSYTFNVLCCIGTTS
jgi:hypothetical protein